MPPEARWGIISGRESYEWPLDEGESTKPKDIGEHLTKAVRAVVKQNPTLSGFIDVVDFAAERNGERDINPAWLAVACVLFVAASIVSLQGGTEFVGRLLGEKGGTSVTNPAGIGYFGAIMGGGLFLLASIPFLLHVRRHGER
jgi:hypothetical protein